MKTEEFLNMSILKKHILIQILIFSCYARMYLFPRPVSSSSQAGGKKKITKGLNSLEMINCLKADNACYFFLYYL